MRLLGKGQNIVIWGAGKIGTWVIKKYLNYYNIRFIVDNKIAENSKEHINGISIFNPSILLDRKILNDAIIVLCMVQWKELIPQLDEYGYKIIKDFIPWESLDDDYNCIDFGFTEFLNTDEEKTYALQKLAKGKKICALFGMCHTSIYKTFLMSSKEFLDRYIIINLPQINHTENKYHSYLMSNSFVWNNCDLIISDLIYSNNPYGAPGAKEILKCVKNDCKKITVTNAVFRGYTPQHTAVRNEENKRYFAWGDKNIHMMIKQGFSIDEIEKKILSERFYSPEFVNEFFDECIKILEREEKNCDIKIADYIKEYGKSRVLYYSLTHPIEEVLLEIGKRIFSLLGLDRSILDKWNCDIKLNVNEELVYPSVLKGLEVKDMNRIISERKMNPGHLWEDNLLTSREYIQKYVSMNLDFFRRKK